jgi:hypothetical protein
MTIHSFVAEPVARAFQFLDQMDVDAFQAREPRRTTVEPAAIR